MIIAQNVQNELLCFMVNIRIQVSDEVRAKLLEVQFQRKLEKQPRATIAEVAADLLEEYLLKNEKAPPK